MLALEYGLTITSVEVATPLYLRARVFNGSKGPLSVALNCAVKDVSGNLLGASKGHVGIIGPGEGGPLDVTFFSPLPPGSWMFYLWLTDPKDKQLTDVVPTSLTVYND